MNRREKFKDNDYFSYYNANPHNRFASDCAIRAIALATDQSWETVYKDLYDIGLKYGFMPNEKNSIHRYLTKLGWVKMKEPRDFMNKKMMVKDFIRKNKETLIIYAGTEHLVTARGGKVYDTWDSSRQTMHTYYIKQE